MASLLSHPHHESDVSITPEQFIWATHQDELAALDAAELPEPTAVALSTLDIKQHSRTGQYMVLRPGAKKSWASYDKPSVRAKVLRANRERYEYNHRLGIHNKRTLQFAGIGIVATDGKPTISTINNPLAVWPHTEDNMEFALKQAGY